MKTSFVTAVISSRAPKAVKEAIGRLFTAVELPEDPLLPRPVSSHPDMILGRTGKRLTVPASYYTANRELVDLIASAGGLELSLSGAPRGSTYPLDAGMNAALMKDMLICRRESLSSDMLASASGEGLRIVGVRQGYAGCSVLVCGSCCVTTDPGISSALSSLGEDCLLIGKEGIVLPGYDSGFIGGSSGFFGGTAFLTGSLDSIRDGKALRDFLVSRGIGICELTDGPVTDIGGIQFYQKT